MFRFPLTSLLLAGAVGTMIIGAGQPQPSTHPPAALQASCLTSGTAVDVTINYLKELVSDTDSVTAAGRQLLKIPQLPDSAVTVVDNPAVCDRAADIYGRSLVPPDTNPGHTMMVFRVGNTRYVTADPRDTAGEFIIHMVCDTSFTSVLATFSG